MLIKYIDGPTVVGIGDEKFTVGEEKEVSDEIGKEALLQPYVKFKEVKAKKVESKKVEGKNYFSKKKTSKKEVD